MHKGKTRLKTTISDAFSDTIRNGLIGKSALINSINCTVIDERSQTSHNI
jgi:hypothetical protein